jgi:predicted RNA-binding protein YlxR (DUF448 family)
VRVVRTASNGVVADRCAPGRGAWLHPTVACFDLAERRRAFERALRGRVAPGAVAVLRAALRDSLADCSVGDRPVDDPRS